MGVKQLFKKHDTFFIYILVQCPLHIWTVIHYLLTDSVTKQIIFRLLAGTWLHSAEQLLLQTERCSSARAQLIGSIGKTVVRLLGHSVRHKAHRQA